MWKLAEFVAAVLLVIAVVAAGLRAVNVESSIDWGWVAVACLIISVWLLPTLLDTGRVRH